MFHRAASIKCILSAAVTAVFLLSCATSPHIDEPAAEAAAEPRLPQVNVPDAAEQAAAEPDRIISSGLIWAQPESPDEKKHENPLPELSLRSVPEKKPEAVALMEVELSQNSDNGEKTAEAPPADTAEKKKSFLELIFDPSSTMAEESTSAAGQRPAAAIAEAAPAVVEAEPPEPKPAEPKQEHKAEEPAVQKTAPSQVEAPVPAAVEASAPVRELYVYDCEGEGWRLEGMEAADGKATENLRYAGREYLGGRTVFSFYPYRTGEYHIRLVKTDFSTGISKRISLKLSVTEMAAGETDASETAEVTVIAAAANETGEAVSAAESVQEPEAPVAEPLRPADAAALIDAAEKLKNAGDCAGAAELLKEKAEEIEWSERDAVYFELGGIYEKCPGARDERLAAEIYRKIVDYYPVSNYWTTAKERIAYLERNFIYIR